MKIKIEGVTPQAIEKRVNRIAGQCGFNVYHGRTSGNYFAFTLRPQYGAIKYRATGHGGRKSWAVCWHGHRRFMDQFFRRYPTAILRSVIATYRGRDDYQAQTANGAAINFNGRAECTCQGVHAC